MSDYLIQARSELINALNVAQDRAQQKDFHGGHPVLTISESIAYATAATLIALAERKSQFVEVGGVRLNIDCIFRVSRHTDEDGLTATVQTEGGAYYTFENAEARAFLLWHEQHADVTRLDEEVE